MAGSQTGGPTVVAESARAIAIFAVALRKVGAEVLSGTLGGVAARGQRPVLVGGGRKTAVGGVRTGGPARLGHGRERGGGSSQRGVRRLRERVRVEVLLELGGVVIECTPSGITSRCQSGGQSLC